MSICLADCKYATYGLYIYMYIRQVWSVKMTTAFIFVWLIGLRDVVLKNACSETIKVNYVVILGYFNDSL